MTGKTARPETVPAKKAAPKKAAAKKVAAKKVATKKAAAKKVAAKKAAAKKPAAPQGAGATRDAAQPRLLSGGNPQIPMGYGDAPVQAYIHAIPDWKREFARRLDALVERSVPGVRKAVKWNTPLYGVEEGRWFLAMHCFERYLKITFFNGASLDPPPAQKSKVGAVRYHHLHESDAFDEARLADWIVQASRLPGERM